MWFSGVLVKKLCVYVYMYICTYVYTYTLIHRSRWAERAETGYLIEGNPRGTLACLAYCKAVGIAWITERTKS